MAIRYDWLTRIEDLVPLYPEWADLARRTEAEVFLTPDWFDVWWRGLAASRRLVCLVARDQGRLVGLLPFAVERIWAGPLPLRLARFAGTDPHCMIFHLPLEPETAAEILRTAFVHLLGAVGCDAVSLTPVSALSDILPAVRAASDPSLAILDLDDGVHTVFELPDSFEAHLSGMSKNRRSQFRRDRKQLTERYAMTSAIHAPDAADFERFIGFHNAQWRAVGKGGNFGDWPENASFYPVLAEKTKAIPLIRFHDLTGTTGLLASQFTVLSGKTVHWRLPARTLDPEAEKLSVGKVSLIMLIEDLIIAGVKRIEAGRGEYDYKVGLGATSAAVHRLILCRASPLGRLRLRLLLAWADFLNLCYYRIWFLKLAPRLRRATGLRPAPLWRSWIRTRI
ncbi:MAG: GNAT family N-acetyltransferase [Tabrizicola sp.]|nr:GNAT family N-acetyltransferase [Tabrizicola sp.]